MGVQALCQIRGQQLKCAIRRLRLSQHRLQVTGGRRGWLASQGVPCTRADDLGSAAVEHGRGGAGEHAPAPCKREGSVVEVDGEGIHAVRCRTGR